MQAWLTSFTKSFAICQKIFEYLRLSYKPGADLNLLKRQWAGEVLQELGFEVEVIGEVTSEKSVLFLGNHLSYLDIVLILRYVPGVSFVSKQEISQWPLIGQGARKIDTIFVKRENTSNRRNAREAIAEGLRQGKRVTLFPSGTTCVNETKDWRRGAFEIAQEEQVWVQPFRVTYSPLREAAFIGDDALIPHMARLMRTGKLKARIEFHAPVRIQDAEASRKQWQDWAREFVKPDASFDTDRSPSRLAEA